MVLFGTTRSDCNPHSGARGVFLLEGSGWIIGRKCIRCLLDRGGGLVWNCHWFERAHDGSTGKWSWPSWLNDFFLLQTKKETVSLICKRKGQHDSNLYPERVNQKKAYKYVSRHWRNQTAPIVEWLSSRSLILIWPYMHCIFWSPSYLFTSREKQLASTIGSYSSLVEDIICVFYSSTSVLLLMQEWNI